MKSKFLALGALALIASPAFAQAPVTSVPGRAFVPVKAHSLNGNGGVADTLWDQSDYDVAQNAFVDQDFTDLPSFSSYCVQDIDTGGASWNVSTASVYFSYGFGFWSNGITTADVQVYPKTGALPDGSDVPPGTAAPCTLTPTTNVDGWIVAADTSSVSGLQGVSGQFWCGVTPQADFATYGQEFHYETTSAMGDHTAWINPGGGFGLGSVWSDVNLLGGGTSYDCAILLEGTGGGGGYTASASGTCPGSVTVGWSGAAANKTQGLVFARNTGNFTIPNGQPCAGTQLGLGSSGIMLVRTVSTGNGSGQISGNASAGACNGYIQWVTTGSCATSSVAQLP